MNKLNAANLIVLLALMTRQLDTRSTALGVSGQPVGGSGLISPLPGL